MARKHSTSFGEYIREIRRGLRLPLRIVADQAGIDRSTLGKIERDQRNPNEFLLTKLAQIYNVSMDDLRIRYISHRIFLEVKNERHSAEILHSAQAQLNRYLQQVKKQAAQERQKKQFPEFLG